LSAIPIGVVHIVTCVFRSSIETLQLPATRLALAGKTPREDLELTQVGPNWNRHPIRLQAVNSLISDIQVASVWPIGKLV
jgi:hypothetical protein